MTIDETRLDEVPDDLKMLLAELAFICSVMNGEPSVINSISDDLKSLIEKNKHLFTVTLELKEARRKNNHEYN